MLQLATGRASHLWRPASLAPTYYFMKLRLGIVSTASRR